MGLEPTIGHLKIGWVLITVSGSYASAMAGAAAGEQNKAQPSTSSQRNRNSKSFKFCNFVEMCPELVCYKWQKKFVNQAPSSTSAVMWSWQDHDLVSLGLSASRILTSLELAASGVSLLLCYSRAELINTNRLWQMGFLWKQMDFLWKKQQCYLRSSPAQATYYRLNFMFTWNKSVSLMWDCTSHASHASQKTSSKLR